MIKINITKIIPIELTNETAYLSGVIIGEGHIANTNKSKKDKSRDYRIVIDISDMEYLYLIYVMIKTIINTKSIPKPSKIKGKRKDRLYFQFRNKSFFYFLTEYLGITKGSKSFTVKVPDKIKNSSKEIKQYFLAGLFDTDGGFRGNSLGFTTASKELSIDTSTLLNQFSVKHFKEKWTNKNYNKTYYGIRIYKNQIDSFLNNFPLQNKEKLIRIQKRFNCGDAGVAKRDR